MAEVAFRRFVYAGEAAQGNLSRRLKSTIRASEVDTTGYDAIFFTGGHAVMYDFPDDADLQSLTRRISKDNEVAVSSLYLSNGAFLNTNLLDVHQMVKDRKVTHWFMPRRGLRRRAHKGALQTPRRGECAAAPRP